MFWGQPRRAIFILVALSLSAACSKGNADEHLRKGNDFLSQSLPKEATIEYRSAIQIDPKRGDIRPKLADTLMLLSDSAGALREYVRAADLLPKDASAQIKAGTMLLMAGAFEDARTRAEKAITLDPKNASAVILRGNALAGLKDVDGALNDYQETLALNPAQEAAYANIATIQISRGQLAEAESSFRKAIEVAPDSVSPRLALANFLWVNNRAPEAEKVLTSALALAPADLTTNRMLGAFYMATNRAPEAETYFQTIVSATKTIAASLSLADYYVASQRFDEARKLLKEVASNPVSQDAATIRLAAVDAAQGNRAVAISKLREVLERRPKDALARLLVARLLLADGKRDEAFALATGVVKDDPNSNGAGDAYLMIAAIQAADDREDEAIKSYEEVLKRQSQPFAAQLALSKLWIAAGSPEKAMTYVQQALAVQPKSPEARAVRIEILLAQNDRAQAKQELASLQKEFPNSILTVSLEGTLQMAEGQLDAARASFNRVAASRPYDSQTIASLVQIDLLSGRKREAVDRIETVLKGQKTGTLLLLAAKTYAAAGNSEKTEEMLTQAIELQPARLQAYSLLGALYVSQGRLNEARQRFEEAVRRNPNGVAVNTVLGMVLGMLQRTPEAEKQYKTVLALDPGFPIAANNLAWLYVSQNRNLDEALQLAQSAAEKMPDDATVNDTLGWIYYRKNMVDPAIRYLELSTQKDPNDAATHYHLGMAYVQAGDFDKAKKALQRALAIAPQFEGSAEAKAKLSQIGG